MNVCTDPAQISTGAALRVGRGIVRAIAICAGQSPVIRTGCWLRPNNRGRDLIFFELGKRPVRLLAITRCEGSDHY
jgi:hypothetical protein